MRRARPFTGRLVRYGHWEAHRAHCHEYSAISVLLTGEFQEELGGSEYDLTRPVLGWKPAGISHADRFGPQGAIFASIPVPEDCRASISLSPGWHRLDTFSRIGPLVRLCLGKGDAAVREDAAIDLIGLTGQAIGPARAAAPPWLVQARERLRDDPADARLGPLARQAGVHRVHLSRAFAEHYGLPPSVYRLRSMLARTLAAMDGKSRSLSDCAQRGAFADHSHAARTVKRATGLTMSEIASLLH